ncbi:maf protein [Thermocrinis albus DSM 14484]|uniref:dTTP/UTP pyrophosphatase n=1 Tax=Thermocrinis albus (strain DSM 14484 / JCM 11386 / HI 11/12) TaxID=638303 RepID=D3SPQ1_THEAH|nr:Maf family nucleotide pyrophosphatase [Thermocrinis albus]ADC89138.1 maf protein [Thermocrinis albus DSM 14484]
MRFLVLASESKRRVEILKMLGFKFFVIPAGIEERPLGHPVATARRLAYWKALKVWKDYKYAVVLGADTLVVVDNVILGKPKDEEEAKRMLRLLSGRWHKVVTGVSILWQGGKRTFHDVALVKFRKLDDEEIEEYIKSGEPMDKAGAYAVQGKGARFIQAIKGDFYTVMGLPASKTFTALKSVL